MERGCPVSCVGDGPAYWASDVEPRRLTASAARALRVRGAWCAESQHSGALRAQARPVNEIVDGEATRTLCLE